jgi:hypothetical protein
MSEPIVIGDGGRRGNRRVKVLLGIAVAVLLLTQVLPRLLGGDDGGGDETFTTLPPGSATATTLPPGSGDAPRETFETFSSKNPFSPLVDLTPIGSETTDTTIPLEPFPIDGTGLEPFPTEGDGTTPVDGGTGSTGTTAPQPPPRQPDRVGLLEVYTDLSNRPVASVRVNDTTYQVARGDEFAVSYRVVSIDTRNRCAQLLFGDDSFTLCEGEEVRK